MSERDSKMVLVSSEVEIRESSDGPRITGIIVPEGRAARAGRAELFAPNSVVWSGDGIALRAEHRGAEVGRAQPVRHPDGTIRISAKATPELRAAFNAGRKYLSVEFHSLAEIRTSAGIRELTRAFVDAAALVPNPEYSGTEAEVRSQAEVKIWL